MSYLSAIVDEKLLNEKLRFEKIFPWLLSRLEILRAQSLKNCSLALPKNGIKLQSARSEDARESLRRSFYNRSSLCSYAVHLIPTKDII